jgi:peptide deformylase
VRAFCREIVAGLNPTATGWQVGGNMVREVLIYPDPVLKQKAKPVAKVDDAIRALVKDMAETMYAEEGIGLAAPQVGLLKRILVVDTSPQQEGQKLQVFINPELVSAEGRTKYTEGCLSIPGEAEEIERFDKVTVRALNEKGETFEIEADGLLAIALQHEMDHLDGVLFVDRLSSLKRGLIRKRMLKYKTEHKRPGEVSHESRPAL